MKRLIVTALAPLLLAVGLNAQNNFSTQGWWEPAGKTYPLVENGSITFRLEAPEARKVTLLFDEWTILRQEMSRGQDGIWETTVSGVKPGVYEYKFVVDGNVVLDMKNPSVKFGTEIYANTVEVTGAEPRVDQRVLTGSQVDILSYRSSSLGRYRRIWVYVPEAYFRNKYKKFPVLYLRHGGGDDESSWVRSANADAIIAANTPGSINAATYDGTLYGYPMTSDNGYFLYYDKSVFTEDDLKTLDGILAAANAAGKKVHMDVSNGWYLASFFLGNGCTLTIEDGKQVIDFNNANGLAAAEAIRAFCNDPAFVTGDDSVLAGGIGDAIACGVSGTWVASAIQEKLGDNYGCCKLPTFTCDGKQVQMGSFLGCKIYGVNSQTAYPVDSMELAEYLTSEKAQIERYNVLNYGPSNVNALADDTIASNLALQALNAQSEFAVSQMVLGGFWTPAEAFGAELEAHSTGDLQTMLDQLVEQALAG